MVSLTIVMIALNPNQEMTNFDYKKYSLENLETWMHDAMSAGEATPQEIYDTIVGVVKENYYTYKQKTSEAYELLALLNGAKELNINLSDILKCDRDDPSPECKGAWNDFWESGSETEYNLREAEYYNKREQHDMNYQEAIASGWEMTADGFWIKEDKVTKWQLPVQLDGLTGECYIELPDDLLEVANLKEGDTIEWIDRGDGSFEMRKVIKMNES